MLTPEQKEKIIEEWRFSVFPIVSRDSYICDFWLEQIDKALSEDRQRIKNEIDELVWFRNDDGVTETENNVDYIKKDDIITILSGEDK